MKKVYDKKEYKKLLPEEQSEVIKALRELQKESKSIEAKERKELNSKVKEQLGAYILKKIGLTSFTFDPNLLKEYFDSLDFDSKNFKLKKYRSAKYQLDQVRRMRSAKNAKSSQNISDKKQFTQPVNEQAIINEEVNNIQSDLELGDKAVFAYKPLE